MSMGGSTQTTNPIASLQMFTASQFLSSPTGQILNMSHSGTFDGTRDHGPMAFVQRKNRIRHSMVIVGKHFAFLLIVV